MLVLEPKSSFSRASWAGDTSPPFGVPDSERARGLPFISSGPRDIERLPASGDPARPKVGVRTLEREGDLRFLTRRICSQKFRH